MVVISRALITRSRCSGTDHPNFEKVLAGHQRQHTKELKEAYRDSMRNDYDDRSQSVYILYYIHPAKEACFVPQSFWLLASLS